jgi:hypothetical protein
MAEPAGETWWWICAYCGWEAPPGQGLVPPPEPSSPEEAGEDWWLCARCGWENAPPHWLVARPPEALDHTADEAGEGDP